MAGDFDVQPLGTVAKVRSGYAFKSDDMGAVGLPIIKIKNVAPPTVDITDCERVPEEVISSIPRVERFELKEGDTLIAMTGATVGKVGRFPCTKERHFLNQRVGKVYLTEPDAADYRYIYFILSQDTYVRQMFGIADGSAQANISGSQIESLEVPLPPLPTQRAIAHVLGTLDDLIELNRETNEILEEMARALFKSWFVDFDPVRAKLEGRPPAGMSKLNPHIPRVWFPDLDTKRRSVCSTEFMVARATAGVSREYLFSLFTDPYFASIYGTLVSGTTGSHQRIGPDSFIAMQVVVPPVLLIKAFTDLVRPIFDTTHSNLRESRDLAALRDTLLPKLLSGEVSVPAAEELIAASR